MTTIYVSSRKNITQNEVRSSAASANHQDQLLFKQAMERGEHQVKSKAEFQEKLLVKENVVESGKSSRPTTAFFGQEQNIGNSSLFEKLSSQKNALEQREEIARDEIEAEKDEDVIASVSENLEGNDNLVNSLGIFDKESAKDPSSSDDRGQPETLQAIESLRENNAIAMQMSQSSVSVVLLEDFMPMFAQLQKENISLSGLPLKNQNWDFSLVDGGLPVVNLTITHRFSEGWSIRLSADSDDSKNMLESYKQSLEDRLTDQNNTTLVEVV